MKSLFVKSSNFTLNNHYKKLLLDCSNGIYPIGVVCTNDKIIHMGNEYNPKDEKDLCTIMLKIFKLQKLEKEEVKYPSSCALYSPNCTLNDVPKKSRDSLIKIFSFDKMKELSLTEDERSCLYSTIMLGIYSGFIETKKILIRDYYIEDVPGIIIEDGSFHLDTKNGRRTNQTSKDSDTRE